MFYWSFPSLVHFWPPQFLILVTPVWPFGRKFRELVFTSRKITWAVFLSIPINNVWSASSAKSRNENNLEKKTYLNALLRND